MSKAESLKKGPTLPEKMTAQHLMDNVSEKERAAIAQSQGFTLKEYDSFLTSEARRERVSGYTSEAKAIAGRKIPEVVDRDQNAVQAELSVVKGLTDAFQRLNRMALSPEDVEELEKQGYELLERMYPEKNHVKASGLKRRAENMFKKAALSGAFFEISKRGTSPEILKEITDAIHERASNQNNEYFSKGLMDAARELERSAANSPLQEARELVSAYESGSMTELQKDILRRFVRYGKSAYILRDAKFEEKLVKFKNLLEDVAQGYRKYGPHSKESENVSGPSEVYGAHQSDQVSGYRSDSKRRPHRDPSRGSGES